ncbi:MAG: hypothetical protein ABIT10_05140 [Alteraurantiacibacter sp.]
MTIGTGDAGSGHGRWLVNAALLVLLAGIAFGLLVPVYTDEIAWRFHERAWLDGGLDVWLNDICGPNSIARAPAFMLPVRWFSATMNMALADPLYIRLTGVALALALVAAMWRLVGLLEIDPARRRLLRACACGLLATGYLPQLLVFSRPEQPLFLAVMGMALITLTGDWRQRTARQVWLASLAIVLLSALALSYHLKGVLYAVFALACLAMLAPGTRHWLPRMLASGTIGAMTVVGAAYWSARFACPDNTVMAAKLEGQNLSAMLQNGHGSAALLVDQILNSHILTYAWQGAIHSTPMSAWLPAGVFSGFEAFASQLLTYVTWSLATVVAARAVFLALRHGGWAALFEPRMALLTTMVGITLVWGVSQITKNSYEATHMLPAWIMVLLLAWTLPAHPARDTRPDPLVLKRLAVLLLVVAACSQALVIGRMTGPLLAAAHDPGRLENQPFSVSLADYASVRRDIARAMHDADMDGPARLNRPVIDDFTYLALQRHYLPLHALGVMGLWRGPIDDPAAYLVNRGSDGLVVSCASLWPAARAVASHAGEICAVNGAQLALLAGGRQFRPAGAPVGQPAAPTSPHQ